MKKEINVERQIVEDYVGNIVTRLCRRTFGSPPIREKLLEKMMWTSLCHCYAIKGRRVIVEFNFPEVTIGFNVHKETFSVADPQSFNKINKFLVNTFRKVKKRSYR